MDKKLKVLLAGIAIFLLACYMILYVTTPNQQISAADTEDELLVTPAQWQAVNEQELGFEASFPLPPQSFSKAHQMLGSEYTAMNDLFMTQMPNGTILLVRVITYPNEMQIADPMKQLKETMEQMLSSDESSVLREVDETSFEGNPELIFSLQNRERRTDARTFIHGQRQYIIAYVAPLNFYERSIYEQFSSTFKLLSN